MSATATPPIARVVPPAGWRKAANGRVWPAGRSWRRVFAEHRGQHWRVRGELLAAFVGSRPPVPQLAECFAACWRQGSADLLAEQVGGIDRIVELLRRLGYWETVSARDRLVRFGEYEWGDGPGDGLMIVERVRRMPVPEVRILWRGATAESVSAGLSWTDSPATARDYIGWRTGARLWRCSPPPGALLACYGSWAFSEWSSWADAAGPVRNTREYLVDPTMIEPVEVRS